MIAVLLCVNVESKKGHELLSHVKGLELVEMADNETCCGFGGTFSVKNTNPYQLPWPIRKFVTLWLQVRSISSQPI